MSSRDSRIGGGEAPLTLIRSMNRIMAAAFLGCCAIVVYLVARFLKRGHGSLSGAQIAEVALLGVAAVAVAWVFWLVLQRLSPLMDDLAAKQTAFLDNLPPRYLDAAIVISAALSLFLELVVIRWQSTVLEFVAFYKNFSLLACFIGLGLGYALATRARNLLLFAIPLLLWQFTFLVVIRNAMGGWEAFRTLPFTEQLNMGIDIATVGQIVALYALLTVVFILTGLAFLPVGQLCGRLMERKPKLRAYGMNLLGSLAGVVLGLLTSLLWTPPPVWFTACFLLVLLFHFRSTTSLALGGVAMALCAIVLSWPVSPLANLVYSPYQLLELGYSGADSLPLIRAAGHYYQRVHDFSNPNLDLKNTRIRNYYDFPFKAHPRLENVAVVGAGTGNDVAAAVRAHAAHVDAIEIDPAILSIGEALHPEHPYSQTSVNPIVNDARSHLRNTTQRYDLIVYGLLDSHTLLSQGSSVRLDSFVYTVEGLREARSRLKPGGVISLSYSLITDELGRKIYLMLRDAFDGRPPICVRAGYDRSVIYLTSNDPNWTLNPKLVVSSGFEDVTAHFANMQYAADVSTDDWPFFYMPKRVYPVSYMVVVGLILALSALVTGNFLSEKPKFGSLSFFFMGAGFMLVETKGITEMGLTFGNTWRVIGIVIAGILIMAWLGNVAVQMLRIQRPLLPYLLLLAALAIGWYVARAGGFSSTPVGRLETAIVLTCPLFFSGIVFSTLLTGKGAVSGMMAMNILGAICGGLLEYNSMYFGFRSLYIVAMGCYLLAFLSDMLFGGKNEEEKAAAAAA